MRMVVELAVATGIDPMAIASLDAHWLSTLVDVVNERNK